MTTYVAFLRAINVGGRRIASDALAQRFVDLGFSDVHTYLASGNVIFDAEGPADELTGQIEDHLSDTLGYEVPAFLRTMSDVATLTSASPFDVVSTDTPTKRYVVFARSVLNTAQQNALDELATAVDQFVPSGSHIFWHRDLDAGESMSTGELESALGIKLTRRAMRTLERIVSKFA